MSRGGSGSAVENRASGLSGLSHLPKQKTAVSGLRHELSFDEILKNTGRDLEHFCVRWDRIRHWRDSSGTQWAEPDRGAGRRFAIEPLWCARPPCAVAL